MKETTQIETCYRFIIEVAGGKPIKSKLYRSKGAAKRALTVFRKDKWSLKPNPEAQE